MSTQSSPSDRQLAVPRSFLNFHKFGVPPDIRRLILSFLPRSDIQSCFIAHQLNQRAKVGSGLPGLPERRVEGRTVPYTSEDYIANAARHGYIDLLKWIHYHYMQVDPHFSDLGGISIHNGHVAVFQWLVESCNLDIDFYTIRSAAVHSLDVLRWTLTKTSNIKFHVLGSGSVKDIAENCLLPAVAATHGNIQMLDWLVSQGVRIGHDIYSCAAIKGHINVLQWGIDHGVPRNESSAYAFAAQSGQLEALKWLENHFFPLTVMAYQLAKDNGHTHIVNWLDYGTE